jgi:hypothetical protein
MSDNFKGIFVNDEHIEICKNDRKILDLKVDDCISYYSKSQNAHIKFTIKYFLASNPSISSENIKGVECSRIGVLNESNRETMIPKKDFHKIIEVTSCNHHIGGRVIKKVTIKKKRSSRSRKNKSRK